MGNRIKAIAWDRLYECFGERLQQDEQELMEGVIQAVRMEMADEVYQLESDILRRFPHLAIKEADTKMIDTE